MITAGNKIVRGKDKNRKIELIQSGDKRFERSLPDAENTLAPNCHLAIMIKEDLERPGNFQAFRGRTNKDGGTFACHFLILIARRSKPKYW